jgi:nicotinamide-nucleotide amidase
MNLDELIARPASDLVRALLAKGKTVATAESCTGGWIAKALTDVPGSSGCFGYGVVSYSNDAKEALLGVSDAILRRDGAVSEATVRAMARGVLRLSGADLAVAVSGVAGPDGGTPEKPVGTVWFGFARRRGDEVDDDARHAHFDGDRAAVRARSVVEALQGLRDRLALL